MLALSEHHYLVLCSRVREKNVLDKQYHSKFKWCSAKRVYRMRTSAHRNTTVQRAFCRSAGEEREMAAFCAAEA